jgi:hypothetical protein
MFTNISEELAASILRAMTTLMMEAASTSQTSVNFYQTKMYKNPENHHLQSEIVVC